MKKNKKILMSFLSALLFFGVVACGSTTSAIQIAESKEDTSVSNNKIARSSGLLGCTVSERNYATTQARLMYDDYRTFNNPTPIEAKHLSSHLFQESARFQVNVPYKENAPFLNNDELQKRLWNRSFSLSFINSCIRNSKNEEMNFGEMGRTVWLLDYAYDKKNNRYKLFFGTNLKTANEIRYLDLFSTDEFAYGQFKQNKRENANIFLGKTTNPFNEDGENFGVFFSKKGVTRNLRETIIIGKKEIGNTNLWSQVINNPKIVFAAVDFMKQQATQDLSFHWLRNYAISQYIIKEPNFKSTDDFEKIERMLDVPSDYQIQEYRDFAVIEMDFDVKKVTEILSTLEKNSQEYLDLALYKSLMLNAIREVDTTQNEQKKLNFKNKDNNSNNFWDTIDRASALLVASQTQKTRNIVSFSRSVFGGYTIQEFLDKKVEGPRKDLGFSQRVIANPEDERLTFVSSGSSGEEFREIFYHRFGFLNQLYPANAPRNSGALVLNSQGIPVGITTGRYVIWNYKDKNKRIPVWIESYEEFNQALPLHFTEKNGTPIAMRVSKNDSLNLKPFDGAFVKEYTFNVPAFNLIDGTDSEKYPLQKNSYRSALLKLYPNGVFNDGNMSTALFNGD